MPQTDNGNSTIEPTEYLYRAHLVFRWMVLAYFLIVLAFVPWSLPRSNAYYWYALAVLFSWNIFASAIIPIFAPKFRVHPALIAVDLIVSVVVSVTGGGHGNILLLYAFSTILFVGLTWGTLPGMLSSLTLGLSYLVSIVIPPSTMAIYFTQQGMQTVVAWAFVYGLVGFVASFLRDRGVAITAVVEQESEVRAHTDALRERSALLGEIGDSTVEALRAALSEIKQIEQALENSEVTVVPVRLRQVAARFRTVVEQSRTWLKSVRIREVSDEGARDAFVLRKGAETLGPSAGEYHGVHSQIEHTAFEIIFGYRFIVLALTYFFFYANVSSHGIRYGHQLIVAAAIYNLMLAFMLMPEGCSKPLLLISLDLLVTFVLLAVSGGYQSIFAVYAFSTPAFGAVYFGLTGTLISGLILGALYSLSYVGNSITLSYLRSVGDARASFEPAFELLLAGLSIHIVVNTYKRLVAERIEAGTALALATKLEERLKVAREVHNGALQAIASLSIRTELLSEKASAGMRAEDIEPKMKEIKSLAEDTISELAEFRSEETSKDHYIDIESELRNLLESLNARTRITPMLDSHVQECIAVLRPDDLIAAFSEIIRNVEKHSGAANIHVSAVAEDEQLKVIITDDGIGFDAMQGARSASRRGHFGLVGLEESIKTSGGSLRIETGPGRGTKVIVEVPTFL